MNFLGMGTLEILIILLVAFIFLGPERMIDAARMFGRITREVRRMTTEVKDLVREEDVSLTPTSTVANQTNLSNAQTNTQSATSPQANSASTEEANAENTDGPVSFRREAKTVQSTETTPKEPAKNEETA